MSPEMKKRQEGLSEEVKEIAGKAQHRLCTRYRRLVAKGKEQSKRRSRGSTERRTRQLPTDHDHGSAR